MDQGEPAMSDVDTSANIPPWTPMSSEIAPLIESVTGNMSDLSTPIARARPEKVPNDRNGRWRAIETPANAVYTSLAYKIPRGSTVENVGVQYALNIKIYFQCWRRGVHTT